VSHLIPGALAIAMMAFLETVSAARGIRRSEDPQLDPDRELTASGRARFVLPHAAAVRRFLPEPGTLADAVRHTSN
jgi:MFS superfamily sulfate permease-like transporter